jgi:ATP-dependent exoDNAse (exonuclease V) beta subunit
MIKRVYSSIFNGQSHIGKENTDIRLLSANNKNQEIEWVWDEMKMINNNRPGEIIAGLFFKKYDAIHFANEVLKLEGKQIWNQKTAVKNWGSELDLEDLNQHLKNSRIPLMYVGNDFGSLEEADRQNRVVILTYHSSKGLDFDAVFLPFSDTYFDHAHNPSALGLVALSRSKRDLVVTYTGSLNPTFEKFLGETKVKVIGASSANVII